jgi:uracil-DNA glycosylase
MLNNDWKVFLKDEFEKEYFWKINKSLTDKTKQGEIIYPPKDDIFRCFNLVPINNIKVVIIGQDPYHGDNQANGLSFSVNRGISIPPSLKNIFTEINSEYDRILFPTSGNLERWSKQGVLLLNAGLTVRQDAANSHKHLKWNLFTDAVIQLLNDNCTHLVFLLWGSFAHKKGKMITREKHLVLETGHPSPLSANRGFWFGNNHFKLTNEYLLNNEKKEIEW